jgi:hypothetical protein
MGKKKSDRVYLNKINEGKFNQYKLALNKLEKAAGIGDALGFLKAGSEFIALRTEVEDYIKNKGGAYKGLDELNKYQERFLHVFKKQIQHEAWTYGSME